MKFILTALLLLLTVCLFTACNRTPQTELPDDNRSVVFAGQTLALPDGWGFPYRPALTVTDDGLSVQLQRSAGTDENGGQRYDTAVAYYSKTEDGYVFDTLSDASSSSRGTTFDLGRGLTAQYRKSVDEYAAELSVTVSDRERALLVCNPVEAFEYNLSRDAGNLSGGGFSVADVLRFEEGESVLYVMLTTEGLCAYREDGNIAFVIRDAGEAAGVTSAGGHLLYMSRNREGVGTLRLVDTTAGKLSDTVALPPELTGQAGASQPKLIPGGGYDMYAIRGGTVWGLSFAFGGEEGHTCAAEAVLDFVESGIVYMDVLDFCMIDAKTAVLTCRDYFSPEEPGELRLYRMVPADELPERQPLVVASLCSSFPLSQKAIIAFNQSSETYRIVKRDYSVYPADQRKRALDTDIAAGDIPDVLLLEESNPSVMGLVAVYENSELLCDLKPLMQADADFDYEGLLSYVTTAHEVDGAQKLFPLHTQPGMTFARAAEVGGVMTPDEYLTFGEAWIAADSAHSLHLFSDRMYAVEAVIGERYSIREASCRFDDPVLADWIDRAGALGNGAETERDLGQEELFRRGRLAFYSRYLPRTLEDYVCLMLDLGASAPGDIVPVGLPNEAHALCPTDGGGIYFAVTAASRHPAACIDLLGLILAETRQMPDPRGYTPFQPVYYRDDIFAQLAAYDGLTMVQNGRVAQVCTDAEAAELPGIKIKFTQEWAEDFCAMLDGISRRHCTYRIPELLFREELLAESDRPAAEMLEILQSRVSVYLSEQFE